MWQIALLIIVIIVVFLYFGLGVVVKFYLRWRFLAVMASSERICLTFDDGPDDKITPQILELLSEYGAKATFFVVGEKVEQHPQLVRRIVEMGHEIGEHGYRHLHPWKSSPLNSSAEVVKARRIIDKLGVTKKPILYRPPYGKLNFLLLISLWDQRRQVVFWNIDPKDYQQQSGQKVAQFVIDRLAPGSVILLHDGRTGNGSQGSVTVTALQSILEEIKRRELHLATVRELLEKSA